MDYWILRIYLSPNYKHNMKKIVFALLALASVTAANAQENSILLYGNAGFNTTNSTVNAVKTNDITWHVTPGVGYQFTKHLTAGVELSWAQTSNKPDGADRISTNTYSAGLFARCSHNIGGHFFFYSQLGLGYQGSYTTVGSHPATDKANGFYAYLTPNLGYAFGKGFAAYASIGGLNFTTSTPSDATTANPAKNTTSSFDFTFGNNFQFGVSKNFACHKGHHHHDANAEMRKVDNDADEDGDKPMKKEKHHHHKDNDKDDE